MRGRLNSEYATPTQETKNSQTYHVNRVSTAVTNEAPPSSAIEIIDSMVKTSENFDFEANSEKTVNALIT